MSAQKQIWHRLGILLIIISFVAYGLLLSLPFLPLSLAQKVWLTSGLVAGGEITFWVGGLLLGKEIVARYKRCLNPCQWFQS